MNPIHPQLLDEVRAYKMPQAAADLLLEHPPLIIAGVTAAGKETIIHNIQKLGKGTKVVTHTTRHPREGEQNGKDYWFVSESRMLELVEGENFIEIKAIHGQQVSGTSIAAYQTVIDEGQKPVMVIDVQGIEEIKKQVFGLRAMFVIPPNFDSWMERLDKRGHMSHVERLRRLDSAERELQKVLADDHFMLVVNHDIQQASKEILDGITDSASQHRNREIALRLIDHIKAY